jgi:hypothetical protein
MLLGIGHFFHVKFVQVNSKSNEIQSELKTHIGVVLSWMMILLWQSFGIEEYANNRLHVVVLKNCNSFEMEVM